ncbi:MAG: tRNA glutamyl-Q(34) synthetase GluQRS [Holophaga sp.]|nr:tRNA glutamyl-Q(34) synthetase GluQRS [Holophaga sp.]
MRTDLPTSACAPAVGRFAPSPTGILHLGNLRTALASWLSVKVKGGQWLVRIEDVDRHRCRVELAERQLQDLAALGLVSDQSVLRQSARETTYGEALATLQAQGTLYACTCTRKDLALMASAPHGEDGLRPYPGSCRGRSLTQAKADAVRFHLPVGEVAWEDQVRGLQRDDPHQYTGDPLLYRRDGCFAYHLAVVVDDGAQGITEVVRGADLRCVTATQLHLQAALGLPHPAYAHVALVAAPDGTRLGKRYGALGLQELQDQGIAIAEMVGWLGYSLGCLDRPEPCSVHDLLPGFSWDRVPDRAPTAAPLQDLVEWIGRHAGPSLRP